MKKVMLLLICAFTVQISFSQEKSKKDITEISFEVDGVCGMCKKRIEGAVMRTKGVKMAEWNGETHLLTVVCKPSKVSEDDLHKAVAAVGHDTDKLRAEDEVYNKIHPCCMYRDEEVEKDQQKKGE